MDPCEGFASSDYCKPPPISLDYCAFAETANADSSASISSLLIFLFSLVYKLYQRIVGFPASPLDTFFFNKKNRGGLISAQ